MKYLFTLPLAVTAFLVACDSGSTAPDPYIKGDLIYERHISPNGVGSMKCNVYSTGDVIMVESNVNMMTDNSNMGFNMEINFGKKPATYRGEYTMDGAFLMFSERTCNDAKSAVEGLDNKKTSCSDNKASFSASRNEIDETNKKFYITTLTSAMKGYCDRAYDNTIQQFNDIANKVEPNEIAAEKATSCDVQVDGNVVRQTIIYPNKSGVSTMTYLGNYKYSVREEYTGIDDETLAKVCETYKKDEDISNLVCSGSVLTFEEIYPDIETLVEATEKYICPAMLNGGMTFENLWFDRD